MKQLEWSLEQGVKEYAESLVNLKDKEGLRINGFTNKVELREFSVKMLGVEKVRNDNYLTLINEKNLSYTIIRL